MGRYSGVGSRLRKLFQDVPESLLPRPEAPSRLTDEDFRLNYRFCPALPKGDRV